MQKFITISLFLCVLMPVFAYLPAGWATCNGGTTGGTGTPIVVTSANELKSALKSNTVIYIKGNIQLSSKITAQSLSNLTIYGLPGSSLIAKGYTKNESGILEIKSCKNVIIQNVTFLGKGAYDCDGYDNLFLNNSTNIWVDHCDFQDGSDGSLDITTQSNYISVTYCRFRYLIPPIAGGSGGSDDHRFTNLIGSGDGVTADKGKLKTTFQYCWWDSGCKGRMPRVRYGQVHVVNNLFTSTAADRCIEIAYNADMYIDKNVFIKTKNPIKGHDNVTFNVTYKDNNTTGTSGTDTPAEVTALSGYIGEATWNPYTAYCNAISTIDVTEVQNKIEQSAGATLLSNAPEIGADIPTLSFSGSASQTILQGNAINNIIFTAGGTATNIYATNLPTGLEQHTSGLVLTISGIPENSGTYTVTATDGDKNISIHGTITIESIGTVSDFWNFSDNIFNNLGTISSTTTINGLTLAATSEKTMQISEKTVSLDGNNFTHALDVGGKADITNDYRYVAFPVSSKCNVTIYAAAGGDKNTRNLVMSDGTTVYGETTTTTTATKYTYNYTGNGSTIYIYSGNSGINIYGIKLSYLSSGMNKTEKSNIIWNGTEIENPEKKTLKLFDIAGRLLQTTNKNIRINKVGIYFVQITQTGETIKIIRKL